MPSALKKMRELYDLGMPDDVLKSEVLAIIGEVVRNERPNALIVFEITVKELSAVRGFWKDPLVVQTILSTYQGRVIKALATITQRMGYDVRDIPDAAIDLATNYTEPQTHRLIPVIIGLATKKFGDVAVDVDACSKLHERMEAQFQRAAIHRLAGY